MEQLPRTPEPSYRDTFKMSIHECSAMKIYLLILLLFPSFVVVAESRRKEETELYELYEYRYIEYREADERAVTDKEKVLGRRAVILAPDGEKYVVKVGRYLGKNYGEIIKIEPDMIQVIEVLPHCEEKGGWIERLNFLPYADKKLSHEYTIKLENCDMWDAITVEDENWDCIHDECQVTFTLINHAAYPIDVSYRVDASKPWNPARDAESLSCRNAVTLNASQTLSITERFSVDVKPEEVSLSARLGYGFIEEKEKCHIE